MSMQPSKGFVESAIEIPSDMKITDPKPVPFFLNINPAIDKILDGKAHLVEFSRGRAIVDKIGYSVAGEHHKQKTYSYKPESIEGLINFFKDIHPAYHQSEKDEELAFISKVLSPEQREDLRITGECQVNHCKLKIMGKQIMLVEPHGEVNRNYTLTSVVHLNDWSTVPPEDVIPSVLRTAWEFDYTELQCSTLISDGTIARANLIKEAEVAYFPIYLLEPECLQYFYQSIKHPSFRSFTCGLSRNQLVRDLERCYSYILQESTSASPDFGEFVKSSDYLLHESAYAAVKIWINLDKLEISPLGVRISAWHFPKQAILPVWKTSLVYCYGNIKSVTVNLPTLWALVEVLGLRLGTDLGIIDGYWFLPDVYVPAWRSWARKVRRALDLFPDKKYLYQKGPTGGRIEKFFKKEDGEYDSQWVTLITENPVYMSHLFDMVRILAWLGASRSEKVKNIAVDGWTCAKGGPESIGPFKIGYVTYGPLPVRSTPVELFYQFDPVRHDEIERAEEADKALWLPLARGQRENKKLKYSVVTFETFRENYEQPEKIGKKVRMAFHYSPGMGEYTPLEPIDIVGDTLTGEIAGRPTPLLELPGRLSHLRDVELGRFRYASPI